MDQFTDHDRLFVKMLEFSEARDVKKKDKSFTKRILYTEVSSSLSATSPRMTTLPTVQDATQHGTKANIDPLLRVAGTGYSKPSRKSMLTRRESKMPGLVKMHGSSNESEKTTTTQTDTLQNMQTSHTFVLI